MKDSKQMTVETIERQRQYVKEQKAKGQGLGVVFADAFLRGMRDVGYKNPAWALAELADNSIQAAAQAVSIRFGFGKPNKSQAKPDLVAISDDGNGMIPEMLSFAVRWGGTDREGDRHGFGRYGYGLPSSAVSLAKRYTVYSKTKDTQWAAVTVDIDDLASAAGDIQKTEKLLTARSATVPRWLLESEDSVNLKELESGTVIILEDLDRLRSLTGWITVNTIKAKILQHFGVIYRHWIPERRLYVHGTQVQAVDPLFLMEHARFFNENPVTAIRVDARTFDVQTSRGTTGRLTVRASVLPPNFQLVESDQYGRKGAKVNKRHEIMTDYNGLLICRERRQIDCVAPRWTKFQNNDANIKVEIDFDPELDEYFGITTSKQQIVIADEMWEKLQHSGQGGGDLRSLVRDLRKRFEEMQDSLKAEAENRNRGDEPRPSAAAMETSEKFKGSTVPPTPEQREDAERGLDEAAKRRAEATGRPKEEVLEELRREASHRRWEVEFATIPEGPFYRPKRLGEQKRLIINTDHPFYAKVYDIAPDVRSALEVLLFVLAERELESRDESETFYKAERQQWSERLRHALDILIPDEILTDQRAAVAERLHESMGVMPAPSRG